MRAFTLIETIIVVTILAVIGLISVIKYANMVESARSAEAYAVLSQVATSESTYYKEYNAYTTTWANLNNYDAAPTSENFTYSLSVNCYGRATPITGSKYYQMGFDGTSSWSGAAPVDLNKCP